MPERRTPLRDADAPPRRWPAVVAIIILLGLCLLMVFGWRQAREVEAHRGLAMRGTTEGSNAQSVDKSRPIRTTTSAGSANLPDSTDPHDPQALRCTADRRLQIRQRLAQLGNPSSPRTAIQSALLTMMSSPQPGDEVSLALQISQERWPDNLELAWMRLMYCVDPAHCNKEQTLAQVVRLDPDNAATWLHAMLFARRRGDDAAYREALSRAARAGFYDSRSGSIFLHIRPVLADLAPPSSCLTPEVATDLEATLGRAIEPGDWADIEALAIDFAGALPSYGALSPCKPGDALLTPHRRRHCLALLDSIATADTLLERQVALSYLLRLEDDPGRLVALREHYRRILWLSSQSHRYLQPMPRDYGTRMWSKGEVNLLVELAAERGEWPPADDWLPDSEERRALILGGK